MARYSKFKYSAQKYGKSTVTEAGALTWVFLVDWNNDGTYDGTNEAAWCKSFRMTRGREDYLSLEGNGFEHMRPDTATLVMDDKDRRFDPRNAGSALSPNVYPGKKCQVAVYDNSVDPRVRYTRFTGYIDGISPTTGDGEVTITCKGNLQPIADLELTSKSAHINTTIHDAFEDLLEEAGYIGNYAIDADAQPIISFAVDGMSAAQVAGQLADAALGQFFVAVDGKAMFYNRSHNYGGSLPTIDESECLKDFKISQPWDGTFKIVDVICRRQIREQPSVIFYLNNPLELTVDQTVSFYPSFQSASDISIGAAEAFENADGTGTNILADTQMTIFTVGPMGGQMGFYTSAAGYITKLELRGRRWKEVLEKFNYTATPGKYDRKFTLDSPWLQDRNYASAFLAVLWAWLDDDRESLVIQIEDRPTKQFAYDLLQKLTFTAATYSISDDYWITGIDEEWIGETGQLVRTTYYLSKIINDATSITAAEVEEELPAPLGLNNPAGDPDTQAETGTGAGSGEFSQILYITCSDSTSDLVWPNSLKEITFGAEIFDHEELFGTPGEIITIKTAGRYIIFLNGYAQSNIPIATTDSGLLSNYSGFYVYKNDTMISQNYPMTAYSRAIASTTSYWQSRGLSSNTIISDFVVGDELVVKLVMVCFSTAEVSRSWRLSLVMYRISEVIT